MSIRITAGSVRAAFATASIPSEQETSAVGRARGHLTVIQPDALADADEPVTWTQATASSAAPVIAMGTRPRLLLALRRGSGTAGPIVPPG
ncbi:hypothetical protein [Trebonia kvetii]|uniref:hypothetical protein n=1 Tax=Trebonia kvetii TaxID=2480626 RepID=UPI00165216DD|nr:hypothetical protein [Trebonia kvetii]